MSKNTPLKFDKVLDINMIANAFESANIFSVIVMGVPPSMSSPAGRPHWHIENIGALRRRSFIIQIHFISNNERHWPTLTGRNRSF
jgi:hypothetical protein